MYLRRIVTPAIFFCFILIPNLSLSAPKDVPGWQQLRWGDHVDQVENFYAQKIEEPGENEKHGLNVNEADSIAYVMRNYRLSDASFSNVDFNVYFVTDKENRLSRVVLLTNPDSYIFKNDFEYVERLLKEKYGVPARSGDHSFKNHLYFRRIWNFESTNIELTYFYDKHAGRHIRESRFGLTTSGLYKTNIRILYYKNEGGRKSRECSVTVQEAMARAEKAGRLSEGRFLYEVTFSEDSVYFGFDRSNLSDGAREALDVFARSLNAQNKNVCIEIQGHTDNTGTDSYNLNLGQARAEEVMRYLRIEHGIPLYRMNAISYGRSRPVVENSDARRRAKNRRVAIVVMG